MIRYDYPTVNLTIANVESKRVCELISAFEDSQITLPEFKEGLTQLSPESLQVAGTFLSPREFPGARLNTALTACKKAAAGTRCYS